MSKKRYSYAKYETNNVAKRKEDRTHKFAPCLQNGRLRVNKWRVWFHCYKQSSFTLKRVKTRNVIRRMKAIGLNGSGGNLDSDRYKYSEGAINFNVEKRDKQSR